MVFGFIKNLFTGDIFGTKAAVNEAVESIVPVVQDVQRSINEGSLAVGKGLGYHAIGLTRMGEAHERGAAEMGRHHGEGLAELGKGHRQGMEALAQNFSRAAEAHAKGLAEMGLHHGHGLAELGEKHRQGFDSFGQELGVGAAKLGEGIAATGRGVAAAGDKLGQGMAQMGLYIGTSIAVVAFAWAVQAMCITGHAYALASVSAACAVALGLLCGLLYRNGRKEILELQAELGKTQNELVLTRDVSRARQSGLESTQARLAEAVGTISTKQSELDEMRAELASTREATRMASAKRQCTDVPSAKPLGTGDVVAYIAVPPQNVAGVLAQGYKCTKQSAVPCQSDPKHRGFTDAHDVIMLEVVGVPESLVNRVDGRPVSLKTDYLEAKHLRLSTR